MTDRPIQEKRDEELPLGALLGRYVDEYEEGMKRQSALLRAQYERPSPMRWPITVVSLAAAGLAVFFTVGIGQEALAGFGGGVLFTLCICAIALAHKTPRL